MASDSNLQNSETHCAALHAPPRTLTSNPTSRIGDSERRKGATLARMADELSFTVTKLRALSLKRLAYMAELQRTGRWRLQYASEEAFNEALRAADADAERWKRLAYGPPIEAAE